MKQMTKDISLIKKTTFYLLQTKMARPKPVNLWTVADVQKWFKRHCGEYIKYSELFLQVNIFKITSHVK